MKKTKANPADNFCNHASPRGFIRFFEDFDESEETDPNEL